MMDHYKQFDPPDPYAGSAVDNGVPRAESALLEDPNRVAATGARFERPCKDQISRLIETEIVPRLLLASRPDANATSVVDPREFLRVRQCDVAEFARIVVAHDAHVAMEFVLVLRQQGISLQSILLDLLGPTARHLGALWVADRCSFVDVTLGLGRLQQVLREIAPNFVAEGEPVPNNRSVFLAPAPGEQHNFGTAVVAEFFRRAGWQVWSTPSTSADEIANVLGAQWYDIVGFSLSGETLLDGLASGIRAARSSSRNPDISVLVGGQLFIDNPDYVKQVGADRMAVDGPHAVQLAESLVVAVELRA